MHEEIEPIEAVQGSEVKKVDPYDALLQSLALPETGALVTPSGVKTLTTELEADDAVRDGALSNMQREIRETTERAREDARAHDIDRLKGRLATINIKG